jgi:hypothetical protein
MANRQPSKPELRSITPNIFMPSDETACLPHYANLAEAEGLDQLLHHCDVGNRFVGGCGRRCCHRASSSGLSFEP